MSYRLWAILTDGSKCVLRKGVIEVFDPQNCPLSFQNLRIEKLRHLALKPTIPEGCTPRLLVFPNGVAQPVGVYGIRETGALSLDLNSLTDGQYSAHAEGISDNWHYISPTYKFTLAQPLSLKCDSVHVNSENENEDVVLRVTLSVAEKGLLSLSANGVPVGDRELLAGENVVRLGASNVMPGSYAFTASSNLYGGKYGAGPLEIIIVNKSLEDKLYRKKVYDERVAETALMKNTISTHKKILQPAADTLVSRIGKTAGTVGLIRGLSAVTRGEVAVFGVTDYISLSMAKKTNASRPSRIDYEHETWDADTVLSVKSALSFAQRYVSQYDPGFSTNNYDYRVRIGKGKDIGGDSAGAALATLVISNILGIPIRSDIAITGTVDSMGNVGEVGGYDHKSLAAFKCPEVTTLIIPNTSKAKYETLNLLNLDVNLVSSHRIVTARTMEDVLKHALVTSDLPTYLAEQSWRGALAAYTLGHYNIAITHLEGMYQLMPEDLTCSLWYNWVRDEILFSSRIKTNERWMYDYSKNNPEVLDKDGIKTSPFILK